MRTKRGIGARREEPPGDEQVVVRRAERAKEHRTIRGAVPVGDQCIEHAADERVVRRALLELDEQRSIGVPERGDREHLAKVGVPAAGATSSCIT